MSADATPGEAEQIPDAHHPAGVGLIKPGYDPALTNEDLAPLHKQTWSSYNIFAFWMSDVHSVGGYLTDLFSWHWLFLVNIVPGILVTLATWMLVDFDEPHLELFGSFDWAGLGFMAAFRDPGALPPWAAGTLGAALATWVTFVPCFLWIFLGAPFIEALRGNKALNAALAAIIAAVVGVILNLAVWFALHSLFRAQVPVPQGERSYALPGQSTKLRLSAPGTVAGPKSSI